MICNCKTKGPCSEHNRLYVPIDGTIVEIWRDKYRLNAQWCVGYCARYGLDSEIVEKFVLDFSGARQLRGPFDEIHVPENVISAIEALMSTRPNKRQDISAYGTVRSDDLILGQWA